jgi:hypothetical protein
MLATPHDVTDFTPCLSPRAEQYEGVRLVFRIRPRSSSGSAFPIESGSDFAIGIILIVFANYERKLIVHRTREGLNARKIRGENYCRWPPYEFRWERRYDPRQGKHIEVKVVDEYEVAIMRKCVSLKAAGYSIDQIRQYLSYEWKFKKRVGGTWTKSRVQAVIACGIQLTAEQERDQRLSAAKAGTGSLNDFEPEDEFDD